MEVKERSPADMSSCRESDTDVTRATVEKLQEERKEHDRGTGSTEHTRQLVGAEEGRGGRLGKGGEQQRNLDQPPTPDHGINHTRKERAHAKERKGRVHHHCST